MATERNKKKMRTISTQFRISANHFITQICVRYKYLNLPVCEQIDHGYEANVLYIVCAMH